MGKGNNKRKHAQCAQDPSLECTSSAASGVAATLALVRTSDLPSDKPESANRESDWTVVKKSKKDTRTNNHSKESVKKPRNTYPSLTYSMLHRLQASIKISDLQNLVLYCLASDVSPQWVSVQNRSRITKAVVLFVPGLEKGMMNGEIPLDDPSSPVASPPPSNAGSGSKKGSASPDDFVPTRMAAENLSVPLQPLAEIFPHWWPVKAPGDERYSKVFSPLHAMLTVPLTKSREEKTGENSSKSHHKGSHTTQGDRGWKNERTRITKFLASREELIENEYTSHPALFTTEELKMQEANRRQAAKETNNEGWFDAAVDELEDGDVPEEALEQGTITAGRSILAMDCEMCKAEGGEMVLTRVSIVDWEGAVILDELVKPEQTIIDYLTQ